MTPIALLQEAVEHRLKLGIEPGNRLTVEPASACPSHMANKLRAHKLRLLMLLQLPFVIVYSEALGATIFFCKDADTRGCLVEAGAEPASIYTREELRLLVEHHRQTPITAADLLRMHDARRLFNAQVRGAVRASK